MSANGLLIKQLRTEAGLSIRALGRLAGVDHTYLSKVERGQARPSYLWLTRLARVWDVPVLSLWLPVAAELAA